MRGSPLLRSRCDVGDCGLLACRRALIFLTIARRWWTLHPRQGAALQRRAEWFSASVALEGCLAKNSGRPSTPAVLSAPHAGDRGADAGECASARRGGCATSTYTYTYVAQELDRPRRSSLELERGKPDRGAGRGGPGRTGTTNKEGAADCGLLAGRGRLQDAPSSCCWCRVPAGASAS